jgi:hypothetical protein
VKYSHKPRFAVVVPAVAVAVVLAVVLAVALDRAVVVALDLVPKGPHTFPKGMYQCALALLRVLGFLTSFVSANFFLLLIYSLKIS